MCGRRNFEDLGDGGMYWMVYIILLIDIWPGYALLNTEESSDFLSISHSSFRGPSGRCISKLLFSFPYY